MGLEERRAIKAAQDGWLPKRKSELREITGAEIAYDIDWDSFAEDAKAAGWLEHNGPQQLAMALRGVCHDTVGKEAVQSGVKKVVFRNVKDAAGKKVSFQNGTIEILGAYAQGVAGTVRDAEIRTCIENGL